MANRTKRQLTAARELRAIPVAGIATIVAIWKSMSWLLTAITKVKPILVKYGQFILEASAEAEKQNLSGKDKAALVAKALWNKVQQDAADGKCGEDLFAVICPAGADTISTIAGQAVNLIVAAGKLVELIRPKT